MTPAQLRAVAGRIRGRYRPPHPAMRPGEHVTAEAMHALAWALEQEAAAEEQDHEREVAEERRMLGLEP